MSAREELARILFIADNFNAADAAHEWEMLTRHGPRYLAHYYVMADGALAAGYVKGIPGTASREDVLEEAAVSLEEAREYGGAYGQRLRRPSNYRSAAQHVRTLKTGTP